MSSSDSETTISVSEANAVSENYLPEVSKERYLNTYNDFMKWRTEKKIELFSESVFLTYFNELAKTMLPSTLWSKYSMLKSTMNAKHNVNFKNFHNLTSFLKKQSQGFKSRKSRVFTYYEVEKFLNEAPDTMYLAVKVALILGITGACRSSELTNLSINDIETHGKLLLLKLPKTQTSMERSFVVRDEFAHIVKKYRKMRPNDIKTDRFFLNYQKGKIHKQVIGKNKISSMPKQIAKYLNLPNCNQYTGNCYRRTSAILFTGSPRVNLRKLKNHDERKKSITEEECIEEEQYVDEEEGIDESDENITKTSDNINETIKHSNSPEPANSGESQPWASPCDDDEASVSSIFMDIQQDQICHNISNSLNIPSKNVTLNFTNCSNFSINLK